MKQLILLGIMFTLGLSESGWSQTPCIYLTEDIQPGAGFANPTQFIEYGGDVYFSADDGVNGIEFWRWNGTDAELIEDIRPGGLSSAPKGFYEWSGDLYFAANDGVNGTELWRWDGTTAEMVADINPGAGHSYPASIIAFSGGIYFVADDGTNGAELYLYDGTSASLVWDINPGSGGSGIVEFEVYGSELCFNANNGVNGKEVWSWDGTACTMLADIRPGFSGSECEDFKSYDGELIFRANDGSTGMELWGYDGTSVYQIMDINPGIANGNPWFLCLSGGYLYFRALDGVWGMELWRYDGTGSPYLLEDIFPGGPHPISSAPSYLTDVDGYLVFSANDGDNGYEIYRHDHTSFTTFDVNPGAGDSNPEEFVGNGTDIFFAADNGTDGMEIFQWDGDSELILGEDLNPGPTGSDPNNLFYFAPNDILFNADDGSVGNEMWDWPFDLDVGSEIDVFSCEEWTSPSGEIYATTGTYVDTIPSESFPLCDSIITINLVVDNEDPTFSYAETEYCTNDDDVLPTVTTPGGTFTVFPAGMIYSSSTGELFFDISSPGSYTIKYVTPGACPDSMTMAIELTEANDASFDYDSDVFCLSQDDPAPDAESSGGTWSASPGGIAINPGTGLIDLDASAEGVYTIKHVTSGVCADSMEFNMTLISMTNDVTISGNMFSAVESGALYQWMKCDPDFGLLPVWGANSKDYTPPTDGCYAVELTAGTCIDTSECECLIFYGVEENQLGIKVSVFPNPVEGDLSIVLDRTLTADLYITDELGRVVYQDQFSGTAGEFDISHLASGVYLLMLTNQDGAFIEKLIKE